MRSIESDGDSIDDAIEKALGILQVARDRVEIEILSDASRGLFGFGGQRARVRATVRAPLSGLKEEGAAAATAARPAESRPSAVERTSGAGSPNQAELGARAKPILEELLRYLAADCRVDLQTNIDPEAPVLHVSGGGSGLVIGRRGETLDALEYLVNRIVARGEEASGRVMIDVEHYRERRRQYLEQLAHRLADKAKQTGRPVTLNPMSPRDRRIVHLALQDDGQVSTRSHGDGIYRKMTIHPGGRGQPPSRRDPSA
jgi:spoIIIJ-associated protein